MDARIGLVDEYVRRARDGPVTDEDVADVEALRRRAIGFAALRPWRDAARALAFVELRWREDDPEWREHLRSDWSAFVDRWSFRYPLLAPLGVRPYSLLRAATILSDAERDAILERRGLVRWFAEQALRRFVYHHRLHGRRVEDHELRLLGRRMGHAAVHRCVGDALREFDATHPDTGPSAWEDVVEPADFAWHSFNDVDGMDGYRAYIEEEADAYIEEAEELRVIVADAGEALRRTIRSRLPRCADHGDVLALLAELGEALPLLGRLSDQEQLRMPETLRTDAEREAEREAARTDGSDDRE